MGEYKKLFLAKKLGEDMPEVGSDVRRIFDSLSRVASSEGEVVNVADLLMSPDFSLKAKSEWMRAHVLSGLKFLERRDMADARREAEASLEEFLKSKDASADDIPPKDKDELSVLEENVEHGEGEPKAYYTITPFYGGYYRTSTLDSYDSRGGRWYNGKRATWAEAQNVAVEKTTIRTKCGKVAGGEETRLSLPYGFAFIPGTLRFPHGARAKILEDEDGNCAIKITNSNTVVAPFSVDLGRRIQKRSPKPPRGKSDIKLGDIPPDTREFLDKLRGDSSLGNIARARQVKRFIKGKMKYSTKYSYKNLQEMGKSGIADCKAGNTYAAGLIAALGIPVRMAKGHYIKTQNAQGKACITDSTGHAWLEVWDEHALDWVVVDATPPGDPNMDDGEMDEVNDESVFEGDFGEQEAEEITEEELEERIRKAKEEFEKRGQAGKENLKPEEEAALYFAKDAGCSPEEAMTILRQIKAAREVRDRRGRIIRNRIVAEFQKIVRDNQVSRLRYKAPVRLSASDDIADPVEAMIDIRSGESDPGGFAKHEHTITKEQLYGGFDVVFVADKSGSMGETDPKSGQLKWSEQQKFIFLFMDALYFAAQEFKRERIRLISPIDIRSCLISFQGAGAAVELPLGTKWGPQEQFKIWKALQHNIGGGTPDHLGLNSAKTIIEEDVRAHPREKNRIRLVLVSADGGSNDKAATMQAKEELKSLGVVVKAAGIGAGAREVQATYFPDGKNLEGFDSAPDWAAEEVMAEARKFYPRRVKR